MLSVLPFGASEVFEIWPNGVPENASIGLTEKVFDNPASTSGERWILNVQVPTLTRFAAKGPARGAVLVIPGGAFHFVSIDNEGYRIARRLAEQGIEAFVLKYRCHPMPEDDADAADYLKAFYASQEKPGPGETEPQIRMPAAIIGRGFAEEDGCQAIRFLTEHAAQLSIDPDRIGVIGFSAGGSVGAHLAFSAPLEIRPAYAALIYGGYKKADFPKEGGAPMFLAVAADDPIVPAFSIARLAEACHKVGAPVTLHLYGNGGHGFGSRIQGTLSDRWFDDFMVWRNQI